MNSIYTDVFNKFIKQNPHLLNIENPYHYAIPKSNHTILFDLYKSLIPQLNGKEISASSGGWKITITPPLNITASFNPHYQENYNIYIPKKNHPINCS